MANMLSTVCFAYPKILSRMLWCSRTNFSGLLYVTQRKGSSLEDRLESHFNKVMKCEKIPLLSNFNVYKKSLPKRHLPGIGNVPLYQLPHWTCEDDMAIMAQQLKKDRYHVRYGVRHLDALVKPPPSCQHFLRVPKRVGGIIHYLYLLLPTMAISSIACRTKI